VGHPHNAIGMPGGRGRDVSSGIPNIPRSWGHLTPWAPGPQPYSKSVGSGTKRLLSSTASKAYGSSSWHGMACECAHRLHLLEDSATALLLVSCTQRCSGQGCTETFLLRFPAPLCVDRFCSHALGSIWSNVHQSAVGRCSPSEGNLSRQKGARRPPRGAGDCPGALFVSALRVRRSQDRLRSVRAAEAILGGTWHPMPHTLLCQPKFVTSTRGSNRYDIQKEKI
jgi:hypothetical protein